MNPTLPGNISVAPRLASRPMTLVLMVVAGVVVTATGALWAHYGTAVFYETIVAGIDACF